MADPTEDSEPDRGQTASAVVEAVYDGIEKVFSNIEDKPWHVANEVGDHDAGENHRGL